MATHSSVPAWRIPGTAEPGGLPSVGSHRVRHDWSDLAAASHDCWFWYICMRMISCLYYVYLVTQSCLILCDPMDYSPPGSSVHGISQARILRWVAISFFKTQGLGQELTSSADSVLLSHQGCPQWLGFELKRFLSLFQIMLLLAVTKNLVSKRCWPALQLTGTLNS